MRPAPDLRSGARHSRRRIRRREIGCDTLPTETRDAIVATHPRPDFNRRILHAFHAGLTHRPRITFGNVKTDALDRSEEGYTRPNFVRIIEGFPWPECPRNPRHKGVSPGQRCYGQWISPHGAGHVMLFPQRRPARKTAGKPSARSLTDRASDYGSEGCRFESCRAHSRSKPPPGNPDGGFVVAYSSEVQQPGQPVPPIASESLPRAERTSSSLASA